MDQIKLLPSFLGGKARWTRHLQELEGRRFVEPFAGSAAISFALAAAGSRPLWNEKDPVLAHVLGAFDKQIVPDIFSLSDYYTVRSQKDWWRYTYCLTRMAYAGIFRHGPRGFNTPPDKRLETVQLRPAYETALSRWKELQPEVTNVDWSQVPADSYVDSVAILDPPFKGSYAPYSNVADYRMLWSAIKKIADIADVTVCFEYLDVLKRIYPNRDFVTRVSRPNGKRPVRVEAMVILRRGEPDPEVQVH